MQAVAARFPRTLNQGMLLKTCDNSGAKLIKVTAVFKNKTVLGRKPAAITGDLGYGVC